MHDVDRCEAVQHLHDAWRHAALGHSNLAKEQIHEALDVLDELIAQRPRSVMRSVRGYIEDARTAITRSDSLGMILATIAALQELEDRANSGLASHAARTP